MITREQNPIRKINLLKDRLREIHVELGTDKESQVQEAYNGAFVDMCRGKKIDAKVARFENCDAYWMTDRHNILVEFKYDIDMENPVERAKVIAQAIAYYRKIASKGLVKSATCIFIADVNECFAIHVNYVNKFVNLPDVNWRRAPSSMGEDEVLVSAIASDAEVQNKSVVFNTADPDFSEEKIFNTVASICNGITRIIPITEGTLKAAFQYFSTKIIPLKDISANDMVGMFYEFIKKGSECFVKGDKIYFEKYRPVKVDPVKAGQFLGRFGEFDENDKTELDRMYDTLISDTERRRNGQFFTPKIWVDEAHRRIANVLGENWESTVPTWDCCCGTKSLTRDYEWGKLFLSSLETSELNASANLNPEAVTFQFDFLNGRTKDLPEELKDMLAKAGKGGKVAMLINPPYGQAGNGANKGNNNKAGCSDTETLARMKAEGLGKAGNELTVQFLYRILEIVKEYGIKDLTIGLYSNPAWMTGDACEEWRKVWNRNATFIDGFAFASDEFEGVKPGWAINFSVWKVSADPVA